MKARRFLNVVTRSYGRNGGLYSLNRFKPDEHLFYPSAAEAKAAAAAATAPAKKPTMVSPLSSIVPGWKESSLRFEATRMDKRLDFLPFYGGRGSQSNILCADSAGDAVLCDIDSGTMEAVPCLNELKGSSPISLSITHDDYLDSRRPDALYVMGRFPISNSCSFEALMFGEEGWQWQPLPSPPWVNDPSYECSEIRSWALLDGGSTICISSHRTIGTYCFDISTGEWSKAGSWTLPFGGRAEHVPDLGNLWFGISDNSPHRLCALDLSSLDNRRAPRLLHDWEELDLPDDWVQIKGSLVYLGAGKFCITRVVHIGDQEASGEPIDMAAVLTGVEVEVVGGQSELQIIKHKSFISTDIHCVL